MLDGWGSRKHRKHALRYVKTFSDILRTYTPQLDRGICAGRVQFIAQESKGRLCDSRGRCSTLTLIIQNFKAGQILAVLSGVRRSKKAYTSVQCGRGIDDNIELNSDLAYSEWAMINDPARINRCSSQPLLRA